MARAARRTPETRRREALEAARERHDSVAARFAETHGLTLSRQVMLLAAFFAGLDDEERAAARAMGLAPAGVTTWYGEHGAARRLRPGLDPRLDYRYRRDPPELVTVMTGHADGLHFGLFHDEPGKAPWLLVQAHAREDGVTEAVNGAGRTVVDYLQLLVRRGQRDDLAVAALVPALEELGEASDAVLREEKGPRKTVARLQTLGGVGPWLPPRFPSPPALPREVRRRAHSSADPVVERWIDEAREALAAGSPAPALLVGHDLFFVGERFQDEAVELLEAGYAAIGREALGRIVRVHAARRDLASVDVYE